MRRTFDRNRICLLVGLSLVAAGCVAAESETGSNTRWADPAAQVVASPTAGEQVQRTAAVSAAAGSSAAGSSAPASAARSVGMSAQASASDSSGHVPNETTAPPAHLRGNTDLIGMIPDQVNGHSLQKAQATGAELASSGAISDEFAQMLKTVGRSATDISVAMGDDAGQGGSFVAIFALRIDGVAATAVLKHYLPIVTGGSDRVQTMDRAIAGKAASCVNLAGNPMWSCYVPRDDVLFVATSDEFLLINKAIFAIP